MTTYPTSNNVYDSYYVNNIRNKDVSYTQFLQQLDEFLKANPAAVDVIKTPIPKPVTRQVIEL